MATASCLLALAACAQLPGKARLNIVFVLDGMRPDSISIEDTPTLWRLRQEGVNYIDGHAVFPTVTRANATSIATGTYPGRNGILGNQIYVREYSPNRAFSNDEYQNLLRLDEVTGGRMVLVKTLAETLTERGTRFAAVSSGSTGSALLLNPRAPRGVGVLINAYFEPGKLVAYPPEVNDAILRRFGPAPKKGGATDPFDSAVDWTQDLVREYVLPELKPAVLINWLTEPDHVQHALSAGSPEARRSIRNNDRHIGLILEKLKALGLLDKVNIFVVSDHGFGLNVFTVNVASELIAAGLKAGAESDDVVIASSGQSILVHVKDRDPEHIDRIARFLRAQEWAGVIFTAARAGTGNPVHGRVAGTFALELIHLAHAERGPDIVFTFPWTSDRNAHGVPGTDYSAGSGSTGPRSGTASGHGGMSPWTVRNTFFAWGTDVKRSATIRVPAGNADLTPTLLALVGVKPDGLDGRVLLEALDGGPEPEQVPVETRTYSAEADGGKYRARIQVTETGGRRYIDKSWRER
ncbi:MAG TPA: alkaline phosphatase family protein [Burkholderiales bacterium]|nr:alkaline phosphatase family protein [Burkholderiales bacterium]